MPNPTTNYKTQILEPNDSYKQAYDTFNFILMILMKY
jgi:hypothetical protein